MKDAESVATISAEVAICISTIHSIPVRAAPSEVDLCIHGVC